MTERTTTPTGLTRRQFLTLAGGVTAGTLLAACAPSAGPATSSDGAGPAADDVTNLIAWFTDRRTINEMTEAEAIPDFQAKNSDITVEMQFVPESELQQKLLTSNAAGNAPDISSIDETFLDTLTKQEVLRPIPEETINVGDEMGDLTAFLYRLPQGADDGRYYGLPNGVFSSQIYYNAGLLDEMGYSPEDIPNNWADYIVWAKELTTWDGDSLEMSGLAFYANEFSMFEDVRYEVGGALDGNIFPTQDSMRLADDIGINAWEFIMGLYNEHQLDSIAEGLNSRERFGAGRAVTLYNWTWFNGFMDTQYADIEWGLVSPPTMDGTELFGRRGPDVGFTLTTQNDNNLDAALTFYRYLVSPAYLSKYCKLRGIQPSLKEMWDDPEFSVDAGPQWGAIALKNQPEHSIDPGFWPRGLVDITGRILPSVRDEGEDITTVLQREEEAGTEFLQGNPQWSILSADKYEANPQWLTVVG